MHSILIVEDDIAIREMLSHYLTAKNYQVIQAGDGFEAFDLLTTEKVDLILLDWMLPEMSGPKLIKKIRQNSTIKSIPVIMLTARTDEVDKIEGLETGADDYLTKPVSLKELNARIRALIRRTQGLSEDHILTVGLIALDPENHEVKIKGYNIDISATEFRLLHYFMRTPDRLHSRAQLLDQVWGQGVFIEERTVDVHVLRLRKLLKSYGVEYMIKTVRGAGYRFLSNTDAQ